MSRRAKIEYPRLVTSATILMLIIMACFVAPMLRERGLNSAFFQNPLLSKLKPLTEVQLLKVKKNLPRLDPELASSYEYHPYDSLTIIGMQIRTNFDGEIQFFNLVNIAHSLDPLTVQSLDASQKQHVRFVDIDGKNYEVTMQDLAWEIEENHLLTKRYFLGTDHLGRDVWSRLLMGGRISLSIAFLAVLVSLIIGVLVGILAGYFGGLLDQVLTWILSVFWSIPAVLFVVVLTMAMGSGRMAVVVGIGFILWVEMAQVVRARVRKIRNMEYVKASRMLGMSNAVILRKHILPNVSDAIYVLAASAFADALMLEAGMSFLGVGISPPDPSWGNMIRTCYGYMMSEHYAYLVLVPSLALVVTIAATVFFSNALKESLELDMGHRSRSQL